MNPQEIAKRILAEPGADMALRLDAFRTLFGSRLGKQPPTIIEALEDKRLLGGLPAFASLESWRPWLTLLSALYGLPLSGEEERRFCQHTGRTRYSPPEGGYKEAVVVTGVQSGKSRIASTIAVYEGLIATPELDGTNLYAAVLAQDFRGARRTIFSYAAAPFDASPALGRRVVGRTLHTVELDSGVVIAAYPCRPASIRGIRARVLVLDEFAYYISSGAAATDKEMLRAARGRLATTGGRLVIISSPYGQSGALWELHRAHYGREDSGVLVWQASAPEMNPTLPADYVERLRENDPEAYRSEILGEFRAGLSTLFDPDAIAACVPEDVRERAPDGRLRYFSFTDAASGSGSDAFTVAVAHADGDRAVLDVVRAWRPPFNPSGVIAEAADLLKRYGQHQTTGDRYAPGFVAEGFRTQGVTYCASERDRSAIYLELLPAVNAGQAVLLDEPQLLRELRGLERRRGPSGRDKVDHRPGSHDDRANAAAGALVLVLGEARRPRVRERELVWG